MYRKNLSVEVERLLMTLGWMLLMCSPSVSQSPASGWCASSCMFWRHGRSDFLSETHAQTHMQLTSFQVYSFPSSNSTMTWQFKGQNSQHEWLLWCWLFLCSSFLHFFFFFFSYRAWREGNVSGATKQRKLIFHASFTSKQKRQQIETFLSVNSGIFAFL